MSKDRLEAFSDGVIAILIMIMVLELRTPHAAYTAVALMWLIPGRRVERALTGAHEDGGRIRNASARAGPKRCVWPVQRYRGETDGYPA
jgi:hypothetical protein